MINKSFGLSKSRIAAFEQCPKRLWLQIHNADAALPDDDDPLGYDIGNEVGALARRLLPDGVRVEPDPDMSAAIARTRELIEAADRPIFEATFEHENVLVRADLLLPETATDGTRWAVAEVKSATGAKDHHVRDVATQLWVIEQVGVSVGDVVVRHINRSFVLKEVGSFDGLFLDTTVKAQAQEIAASRSAIAAAARETLEGCEPECAMGVHCDAPYSCEFKRYCSELQTDLPDWPIAQLPNTGARLAGEWAEKGVFDIRELPEDASLNLLHERIRQSVVAQSPYHDSAAIIGAIKGWAFPRTWLDFETISFPIPRWIGTHAWQAIQFQFSAHVETEAGDVEHIEALDLTGDDPRCAIVAALLTLPENGAVIAWNASFERRCLKELASAFPQHAARLLDLAERLYDPMPLVRAHYYHPEMRGSFSIKKVLPTLAPELAYDDLAVGNGLAAQRAYLEAIAAECSAARKVEIEQALRAYCGRDSWAMVVLCRRLCGLD